jgi:hypothetical protein
MFKVKLLRVRLLDGLADKTQSCASRQGRRKIQQQVVVLQIALTVVPPQHSEHAGDIRSSNET